MTKLNSTDRSNAIAEMTGSVPRESLFAKKVKISRIAEFYKTEFYTLEGVLLHTVPAIKKQPTRGQRSIEIKGTWYNLRWVD
jgi:hypothetical protein